MLFVDLLFVKILTNTYTEQASLRSFTMDQYKLNNHSVLYQGSSIYQLPEQEYAIKECKGTAIVYTPIGSLHSQLSEAEATCYLFVEGAFSKTFIRQQYRAPPMIYFYNDHLIIHVDEGIHLYKLNGDFVQEIAHAFEMPYDIKILDEKYFLLYRWVWQPFFAVSLYNFEKVLGNDEYIGHEVDFSRISFESLNVNFTVPLEQYENEALTQQSDETNQITLRKDFSESNLIKQLLLQNPDFKYVKFAGEPIQVNDVTKLSCRGGNSGLSNEHYLYSLVKFTNIETFYADFLTMIVGDYRHIPDNFECFQILTIDCGERKYEISIRNMLMANFFKDGAIDHDYFTPWQVDINIVE